MTSLYTIGFTKKNAPEFFGLLRPSGATAIVDIRLNNVSPLAGFTKRNDLEFFARELCGMSYRHELLLAPTSEIMNSHKSGGWSRATFEEAYLDLIRGRQVESVLDPGSFDNAVLRCSESDAGGCHRSIAADHLARAWGDFSVSHL